MCRIPFFILSASTRYASTPFCSSIFFFVVLRCVVVARVFVFCSVIRANMPNKAYFYGKGNNNFIRTHQINFQVKLWHEMISVYADILIPLCSVKLQSLDFWCFYICILYFCH